MPPADHTDKIPPFDTPDYIAGLCAALIRLAEAERMDMLAYLLGMAQLEAETLKQKKGKGRRAAES